MNYAKRRDLNHNTIVQALVDVGAQVKDMSAFPGCLDILVAYRGRLILAEIKTEDGELTKTEQALIDRFARQGVTCPIWRNREEALRAIGAIE